MDEDISPEWAAIFAVAAMWWVSRESKSEDSIPSESRSSSCVELQGRDLRAIRNESSRSKKRGSIKRIQSSICGIDTKSSDCWPSGSESHGLCLDRESFPSDLAAPRKDVQRHNNDVSSDPNEALLLNPGS